MPIPLVGQILHNGLSSMPYVEKALYQFLPWALLIYALRWFFGGTKNNVDRVMHGRVVIMTVNRFFSVYIIQTTFQSFGWMEN